MAEPESFDAEYKTCGKCKQSKPVREFYRDWRGTGYRSPCKACLTAADNERKERRRPAVESAACPAAPDGYKKCSKCKTLKLVDEFRRVSRTGMPTSYCKLCTRAANRESYRRRSNRDGRPKAPITMPIIDESKRCTSCYKTKPIDQFHRNGNIYRAACKSCRGKADRERRQDPSFRKEWLARRAANYQNNRESISAAAKKTREQRIAQDPALERQRRHDAYVASRETVYERNARWRAENLERHRETARQGAARRRAANPEPVREVGRRAMSRRRARLRNLPTESYTLEQLLERDGTCCVLCHEKIDLMASYPEPLAPTVEHLECLSWPDSPGDVLSNMAVSHFKCNIERRTAQHPQAARKRAELLAADQVSGAQRRLGSGGAGSA